MIFKKVRRCVGEVTIPGDKSISHRAVMFGSLANGTTSIEGFLKGADCLSTISCFRQLGIDIEESHNQILVHGKGLHGLKPSDTVLNAGNSGTTTRLLSGILSGQAFTSTITGDDSIQKRPMNRIIYPLREMGASIDSISGNGCAPLKIESSILRGIEYHSPVASAQVKSSILLAGLYANGKTTVHEPAISRNHSEIMLQSFGAEVSVNQLSVTITPEPDLQAIDVQVPGDISSAAYFMVAGLIVPNSEIKIKNVGINPTRDGIIKIIRKMGGHITLENIRNHGEPIADVIVKSSSLKGTIIGGDIIPTLIDELPIIAVMAATADGTTVIKDAAELKVKESNRIDVMVQNLSAMGCDITATEDGMIIHGKNQLHGATIDPHLDHRIAMSFAVASLIAQGDTNIVDASCVDISYPSFYQDLNMLCEYL